MTKKRLSDLLKEEASKSDLTAGPETPASSQAASLSPHPPAAEAAAATPRRQTSSRRRPTSSRTATTAKTTAKSPSPASGRSKKTSPQTPSPGPEAGTVSQSSDRVTELETALAQVQAEKAAMEKTIQGLQADLEAQQTRLFELKDSLDKAEASVTDKTKALKATEAALAEAKQTILNLTTTQAPPPVPAKAPVRRSGIDIVPRQPRSAAPQPGYVRGVPSLPPQSDQPNPMLSDADIGWVD